MCEATYIKDSFVQILEKKMLITDVEKVALDSVYDEMLRKLCNTRIQEFLSTLKQKITSSKGQASTAGQNLRDHLLTQHTNLQSRIHY